VFQKVGMPRKKTAIIKLRFMQLDRTATWQEQVIIPNLKTFWRKFRGETNNYRLYYYFWRISWKYLKTYV